ncbi:elongation factor G [Nitrospira sp. NS4]|uniref:elongation factor G n=1 Tax=Nitrospira sp. NS4 TaxID=3414498 RepID=UPI003C2F89D7
MEDTRIESVRNVALVSNLGAGKTSLSEALLFAAGAIPVLGSVSHGTTTSDFEPEEQRHRSSLSTSLLHCVVPPVGINLLDPPGALSLMGDILAALRASDAVILVLNGEEGVRTELARAWSRVTELGLPCLAFVNGLDRPGASFLDTVNTYRAQLNCNPVPLVLPTQAGPEIDGVIDLLEGVAIYSGPASPKVERRPIPESLRPAASNARTQLLEAVAETNERLLESYLASTDLGKEELIAGLRQAVLARQVMPVLGGSALHHVGISPLLQAIQFLLPSPAERLSASPLKGTNPDNRTTVERRGLITEPFSAHVFKTLIDPFVGRLSYCRILSGTIQADAMALNATRHVREKLGHFYTVLGKHHTAVPSAQAGDIIAIGKLKDTQTGDTLCQEQDPICYPGLNLPRPVLSFAIEPKSHAEIDKVSLGLHKLIEEDPTLEYVRNTETKELVLSGMGQLHIDLALEKLHRKFGVDVILHAPKVPYRESIRTKAEAQGKYKKQTGGHGQYGDCWLELAPLGRGEGFRFENRVVGGAIPRNFIPAVEKGVVEAMQAGGMTGFPVVDVEVAVYDGSHHPVDSSELSFKIAGSMAFKKALESAHPVLLEPMMRLDIDVPADTVGTVMGDLNARRGRILTVTADDHAEQIKAQVPLAELLTYASVLNAMTGGRGSYVMELSGYEEVPGGLAGKIIEAHKAEKQLAAAH